VSHKWSSLSNSIVDEIAEAVTSEKRPVYKRILEPGDNRHKIFNDGSELFLSQDGFSIRFGKRVLELGVSQRWEHFLLYKTVRRHFLAALKRVAVVAGAQEALILPEGTILADVLYENVEFHAVKKRAIGKFGPPDLRPSQFFTKQGLSRLSSERVHYFLWFF
jgi:hypothetical protein